MAVITLTIPDDHTLIWVSAPTVVIPRILDAVAQNGGYDQLEEPRPTRPRFLQMEIAAWLKRVVVQSETRIAREAAAAAADAKAESEVVIT
jgi:hypothetical protein